MQHPIRAGRHVFENPLVDDIAIADMRSIVSLKGFKFVITNLPYREQDEAMAGDVRTRVADPRWRGGVE